MPKSLASAVTGGSSGVRSFLKAFSDAASVQTKHVLVNDILRPSSRSDCFSSLKDLTALVAVVAATGPSVSTLTSSSHAVMLLVRLLELSFERLGNSALQAQGHRDTRPSGQIPQNTWEKPLTLQLCTGHRGTP